MSNRRRPQDLPGVKGTPGCAHEEGTFTRPCHQVLAEGLAGADTGYAT